MTTTDLLRTHLLHRIPINPPLQFSVICDPWSTVIKSVPIGNQRNENK